MRNKQTVVELNRIESGVLARLARIEGMCLLAAGLIAILALLGKVVPSLAPWIDIPADVAAATLACAAGFALERQRQVAGARILSRLLAISTALVGLTELAGIAQRAWGSAAAIHEEPLMVPALAALSFVFLAVVLMFLPVNRGKAAYIPDLALFGLGACVLSLIAADVFGTFHVFADSVPSPVTRATVFALVQLSFAAFSRRAEFGQFSIFLGHGIGSRIARGLLPFLLVLPYFREAGRAVMVGTHRLPDRYAAAVLASTAAMISVGLLILIARHIRNMEGEIRDLSLRDELTGLYNLRGFQLLAEQALRLAQRSGQPFSVLFVDVDDLKQINDTLGHGAGSRLLVAAAEFLQSTFRETDVLGRVGGDEFAIAGQFGIPAIEAAEQRLELESSIDTGVSGAQLQLRLSMGYVMADTLGHETLQDLLDQADAAMYRQKRTRKRQTVEINSTGFQGKGKPFHGLAPELAQAKQSKQAL